MKLPRRHLFRNKQFRLAWKRLDRKICGECETRRKLDPEIRIDPKQSERELLDTILHEGLHASLGIEGLSERKVTETAQSLSSLLWKMGYRAPKLIKKKKWF